MAIGEFLSGLAQQVPNAVRQGRQLNREQQQFDLNQEMAKFSQAEAERQAERAAQQHQWSSPSSQREEALFRNNLARELAEYQARLAQERDEARGQGGAGFDPLDQTRMERLQRDRAANAVNSLMLDLNKIAGGTQPQGGGIPLNPNPPSGYDPRLPPPPDTGAGAGGRPPMTLQEQADWMVQEVKKIYPNVPETTIRNIFFQRLEESGALEGQGQSNNSQRPEWLR